MEKLLKLFERRRQLRSEISEINSLSIFGDNQKISFKNLKDYFTFNTRDAMLWFTPDWDVTRSEAEGLLKIMNADNFNGRRYEWRFSTEGELIAFYSNGYCPYVA